MGKLEQIFEEVLKESQFSIETINDGIEFLSNWNNALLIVINNIIDHGPEKALLEARLRSKGREERNRISMDVARKIAELSKNIIDLSSSINVFIGVADSNGNIDEAKHNAFILQINASINTMATIQEMLESPDYNDLNDILIGLEKNFRKFYNGYITSLNIADPNKILRRPKSYT